MLPIDWGLYKPGHEDHPVSVEKLQTRKHVPLYTMIDDCALTKLSFGQSITGQTMTQPQSHDASMVREMG
jgi:hypothetical protein